MCEDTDFYHLYNLHKSRMPLTHGKYNWSPNVIVRSRFNS